MEFRRSGQRDERRRRVLLDERLTSSEGENPTAGDDRPAALDAEGRAYSLAALAQHQPPITSWLPKKIWKLLVILLSGGIAIAAIETLYARVYLHLPADLQSSLAVLDLQARGSLAAWFATVTLFCGAIASLLVYAIRRHRLDDYRGRYRVWQWTAGLFVIGSLDAATTSHAALQPLMIHLTGYKLLGDGAIWPVLLLGTLVGLWLLRLGFEMWTSRLATLFLCLGGGTYLAAVIGHFHPEIVARGAEGVLFASSTLLAGHFCLVFAVALFGRHVDQEAQGERPMRVKAPTAEKTTTTTRKPRRATTKRTTSTTTEKREVRIDAAHESAKEKSTPTTKAAPTAIPVITRQTVQKPTATPTPTASATATRANDAAISKAERRRLRKLERRQGRYDDGDDD